jgi:hypothetical protein
MVVKKYTTLQEAWEKINEWLAFNEEEVKESGGSYMGTTMTAYDLFVQVDRCWVDPTFDFGAVLGYTKTKWTALTNNYIDYNHLDMVRAEISGKNSRSSRYYNIAYHFANSHDQGKNCLIALTFAKRMSDPEPVVTMVVRASEATKRLLFDFTLVQRIVEHVYGHSAVKVNVFFPVVFITPESFLLYNLHKDVIKGINKKIRKGEMQRNIFRGKILDQWEIFKTIDSNKITYKTNRRVANQIQGSTERQPLTASMLLLKTELSGVPEDIIAPSEVAKYKRQKNKDAKKLTTGGA